MKKILPAFWAFVIVFLASSCIGPVGNSTVKINDTPVTIPAGVIRGAITSDSGSPFGKPVVKLFVDEDTDVVPAPIELTQKGAYWEFEFSEVPPSSGYSIEVSEAYHVTLRTEPFTLTDSAGVDGKSVRLIKRYWKVETAAEYTTGYDESVLAGIAIDSDGNIYAADFGTHRILKKSLSDDVTDAPDVFAGSGTAGSAATGTNGGANLFTIPQAIVIDESGDSPVFYVADSGNHRIMKIEMSGDNREVSVFAGSGSAGFADATGTAAQFDSPAGLALGGGNLYVADRGNNRIRIINTGTGVVNTLENSAGDVVQFNSPAGLALDGGNLYVAEEDTHWICKIEILTAEGKILAGRGAAGYEDRTGLLAKFSGPTGLAYYNGCLFVADMENHCVRKIDINTGAVITLAGNHESEGFADGVGLAAQFRRPIGVAFHGGNLYVTDTFSPKAPFLIRKLTAN
jgi:sugar lactone lactonase YvrE